MKKQTKAQEADASVPADWRKKYDGFINTPGKDGRLPRPPHQGG